MPRVLLRSTVVIVGLGMTLVGCAAAPLVDQLPANIGLPAGTPARPATPYQYPAVHDMPPPRATAPLSEEQQFKLEQELQSARDHQEGRTVAGKPTAQKAKPAADKKSVAVKKKLPAAPIIVPPAGANGTGPKTNP
jgi:hypothetical protein